MIMKYTSNLSQLEFEKIQTLLPMVKVTKPRKWSYHEIRNGIMYILVS